MPKNHLDKDHLNDLNKVTEKFIQATQAFDTRLKESELGYKYIASEQYSREESDYYEDILHRKSRVYNLIWAQFNTLYGNFISNKLRINFRPDVGGTREVSEVLEDLKTHISFANQMPDVISRWLLAGFVRQGFLYPRFTDEQEADGSVVITNVDEFDVSFDPEARDPLLKDSEFWFRSQWMSREELTQKFPEHKDKIDSMLLSRDNMTIYDLADSVGLNSSNDLLDSLHVTNLIGGKYRVVQYHYFKRVRRKMAMDLSTGDMVDINLSDGAKQQAYLALNPNLRMVSDTMYKEKRIKTYIPAIMYELKDIKSNFQDESHDLIPLSIGQNYVKKARDTYGIFRVLKDSQDAFNEFSNINEDLAKKTARPKKITKPDKIKNYQQFESQGDQPGFTIEADESVVDLSSIYDEKIPEIPQIAEHIRQSILAVMPHLSGITANLSGHQEGSAENASLFAQRVQQGQQGFQPFFSAYRQSSKFLWEKVLGILQQNYTSQRIIKIYDQTPYGVNDRNVVINMQIGSQMINDLSLGTYKVIVDDNFGDQTSRLRRLNERTAVAQLVAQYYGPQAIDPEWLLGDTDIEDVGKVIENIRQGQQAMAEAQGQQAELDNAERIQKMALDRANAEDDHRGEYTEEVERDSDGKTRIKTKTVQ